MEEPLKDVELLCVQCLSLTDHSLTYQNGYLVSLECQQCGRRVEIAPVQLASGSTDVHHISRSHLDQLYHREFLRRILTKPARMEKELQEDLSVFLLTLPLRLLTKPYRLVFEALRPDQEKRPAGDGKS